MADLVQNRIEEDLLTPERLELFLDSLLRKGRQETTIVRYRSTLLPPDRPKTRFLGIKSAPFFHLVSLKTE